MRSTAASLVVIGVLVVVSVTLQVWRDRGWAPYQPATPVMWLQRPEAARVLGLGFDNLVADIYWIRAVVYFGGQRLSTSADKNYDLLYPLLNLVTSLDPRFAVAYRFGAIFLSEPAPGGPDRPDQAVELLRRGWERTPERWEYPHDIGFVYFWRYRDYEKAAEWFERASEVPGSPVWLKSTAATTLVRGGDRESARLIWQQMRATAEDDWLRREADIRLLQFDALDEIDELNTIVWRYKARTGRMPHSWEELVAARVLRAVPLDPAGVPYALDPVNEDVQIAMKSPLWPLPEGYLSSAP